MLKVQSEKPKQMTMLVYEQTYAFGVERMPEVWRKLNLRETFVENQVFPYRVEFDAESQHGSMQPGELNIHHGPFLSAHGAVTEVSASYRGLQYFYGSYVLSFRLVRPVKLEFFREGGNLRMRITYFVAPWFAKIWRLFNRAFWRLFSV